MFQLIIIKLGIKIESTALGWRTFVSRQGSLQMKFGVTENELWQLKFQTCHGTIFGEVQYLRYRPRVFNHDYKEKKTTPLGWPPSTLSCLTGSYYRASYSWRGKANNGGFSCLCRIQTLGNWWGHIKTIKTNSPWLSLCYPQSSAVLLEYFASVWMFSWTPGVIFQTGATSNTHVKVVKRSINSCQASSVDW